MKKKFGSTTKLTPSLLRHQQSAERSNSDCPKGQKPTRFLEAPLQTMRQSSLHRALLKAALLGLLCVHALARYQQHRINLHLHWFANRPLSQCGFVTMQQGLLRLTIRPQRRQRVADQALLPQASFAIPPGETAIRAPSAVHFRAATAGLGTETRPLAWLAVESDFG